MAFRLPLILRPALVALALAAPLLPAAVEAAPPAQQKSQAPGFFRMALGAFEVTALYDGYVDIDTKLLSGASAKDIQDLLARMFQQNTPGVQTAVNAFLVHTGSHLVLIDTGTATAFGPTLGFVLDNIRAAGYDPAQIDTVLLTHLHPDHAYGLLTRDGQMAFPNAEIRTAKTEADFWLDEATAAAAPKESQPVFAKARQAVAPYIAAGRLKTYQAGEDLVPGITSVAAIGHTPGHTAYLISSEGKSLLAWGDIVHNHAIQLAKPEVAIEYDSDKTQAVATRKKIFADAARDQLWIAGAHMPFPGIGHVRADQDGYSWVPVEYGPLRGDR